MYDDACICLRSQIPAPYQLREQGKQLISVTSCIEIYFHLCRVYLAAWSDSSITKIPIVIDLVWHTAEGGGGCRVEITEMQMSV